MGHAPERITQPLGPLSRRTERRITSLTMESSRV